MAERKVSKNKNFIPWIIIIFAAILMWNYFGQFLQNVKRYSYSEFVKSVKEHQVTEVTLSGNDIVGKLKNGVMFSAYSVDDPELIKLLLGNNIKVEAKPIDSKLSVILLTLAPWLFFLVIMFLIWRQMQGVGTTAFSFGKSKAKLFSANQSKITFNDVAGVDEAKQELQEIIEFLKDPQKFQKLGGKIPKGVLLIGSPGTGKTLLARAVAGEAGVPFFSISGSDFVEMFVGVGASRVRDLFDQGKKSAPCIIFIDELDAVGRHRGAGLGGGHDEREQTLNQLLVEMDGFDGNTAVILVAATNRPDVLDPALLRPGRFDRTVVVDNPDILGREGILKVHVRNIPLDPNVNLKILAQGTPGFSGADLANLVNESALLAARRDKKYVTMEELEEAKDKVMMGPERRSRIISDKEKKVTAYHEAGHALLAKLLPGAEPLHKVTIIPRGRALGITFRLPTEDRYNRTKTEFFNDITILLGGRVAEELILKDITTGARNDLEIATDIAHKMVCEYGMTEFLGPRTYGKKDQEVFLGRDLLKEKNFSEETSKSIDAEIRKIIDECYNKAHSMISANKEKLINLAEILLKKEVLDGEQVNKIFNGSSEFLDNAKNEDFNTPVVEQIEPVAKT
ncbi:MAG: ATP-dependent zinc metalloprotease FtsH [Candidatus Firestonebacteria bacterium]